MRLVHSCNPFAKTDKRQLQLEAQHIHSVDILIADIDMTRDRDGSLQLPLDGEVRYLDHGSATESILDKSLTLHMRGRVVGLLSLLLTTTRQISTYLFRPRPEYIGMMPIKDTHIPPSHPHAGHRLAYATGRYTSTPSKTYARPAWHTTSWLGN